MNKFTAAEAATIDLYQRVDSFGGENGRYIVVEVEYQGTKRIFLRGQNGLTEHRNVFGALMQEIAEHGSMTVSCLGGGHFRLSPDDKLVFLDDSSLTFGEEKERDTRTVELFAKALPEYKATTSRKEFYGEED